MNRSEREQRRQRRQFERTKAIAHQLYLNRVARDQPGDAANDWKLAEDIAHDFGRFSAFEHGHGRWNPWRWMVEWWESTPVEKGLETLVKDLQNLAIFDLVSLLANIAIIVSLGAFLTGGEQRHHDEQVYEAWQVITSAYGQPGNGGRIRALEFLNSTPGTPGRRRWFGLPWAQESLNGVDISKASLAGIKLSNAVLVAANLQNTILAGSSLQNANLGYANLQNSVLDSANLQSAILLRANLQGADLRYSNLQDADLQDANLQASYLWGANLQGSYLRNTLLQDATLIDVDLQDTSLVSAILLATDMRYSSNLTSGQLRNGKSQPFLCNVALPESIDNIDPDRDCEKIPHLLSERDNKMTLAQAQKKVDDARQKKWN